MRAERQKGHSSWPARHAGCQRAEVCEQGAKTPLSTGVRVLWACRAGFTERPFPANLRLGGGIFSTQGSVGFWRWRGLQFRKADFKGYAWLWSPRELPARKHVIFQQPICGGNNMSRLARLFRPSARMLALAGLILVADAARADDALVLAPGDSISYSVLGVAELDRTSTVGVDGQVQLPLAGWIDAAGLTIEQLRSKVAAQISEAPFRTTGPDGADVWAPDQRRPDLYQCRRIPADLPDGRCARKRRAALPPRDHPATGDCPRRRAWPAAVAGDLGHRAAVAVGRP